MSQDDTSNPDVPFAVGLTLERLNAQTVDEDGKPAFVTNNPMELLRKVHSQLQVHTLRQCYAEVHGPFSSMQKATSQACHKAARGVLLSPYLHLQLYC